MNDPVVKAKWVLETNEITGVPAEYLHDIAKRENIRFKYVCLPNDPKLGGQLLYKGQKKGIIINTLVDNLGKHNFTFSHELGHYFLAHQPSYALDGQSGFWCSVDDIGNGMRPQEVEANCFAAELLMPSEYFRLDMSGANLDFTLISSLANKYMVSKHAASNRLLDFIREPYIVFTSTGTIIDTQKSSKSAKSMYHPLKYIPKDTIANKVINGHGMQKHFIECDPEKWRIGFHVGMKLYSWTRGANNHYMTILRW